MAESDQLLDKQNEFTKSCEEALIIIFKKFDLDKDACLNDKELDDFATATNGKPVCCLINHTFNKYQFQFDKDIKEEIINAFDVRESDNALTAQGFIELYHLQTQADAEETQRDLKKHGFAIKNGEVVKEEIVVADGQTINKEE